jgi:carboxymethylenebutenolidase
VAEDREADSGQRIWTNTNEYALRRIGRGRQSPRAAARSLALQLREKSVGEDIWIDRSADMGLPAYLARPARRGPGVLLLHGYWGVTPHLRRVADMLARHGFVALAPSLFNGVATDDPGTAQALMAGLRDEQAELDLTVALRYLLAVQDRVGEGVGAVGFSVGGWAATRAAALMPEVTAVSAFYGFSGTSDYDRMDCALQLHLAGEDDYALGDIAAFETLLREAGREFESFWYPWARHGFFNEDHPEDYDPAARTVAWQRLLLFLGRHLRPSA